MKFIIPLIIILFSLVACDDNSTNKPSQNYIPNEWILDVSVDSVISANRLLITINQKTYTVAVSDLEVFETTKNAVLANQANLAGISEDSAVAIGNRALFFAKELLLNRQIRIVRDSLYGNSLYSGELIRHVFVNNLKYDSLMKSLGLTAPKKPHPDDKVFLANVSWIYDGDTFDFKYDNTTYKVRILNIDCYETQINDRLEEQADRNKISVDSALFLGLAAKDFAIQTLKNKTVTLKRLGTAPNYDVYDRYLRWLEIDGMKYDSLIKVNGFDAN